MILTHCARLKDFSHTSFAEIQSFKEILESNLIFRSVDIRDYEDLSNVAYVRDLTVFAAGKDFHANVLDLANRCDNLYIVVQDPNWPTSLSQIKRPFHLITPFKALEGKSLEEAMKILKSTIPTIDTSNVESHRVVDFGSMLAYNRSYFDRYAAMKRTSEVRTIKGWSCYVGSLKKDRIEMLSDIARSEKVSFFGNFTEQDFLDMSSLQRSDLNDCQFFGRIAPTEVVRVYQGYESVIFCPDDKIFDLDTSYLRIGEMCMSGSKVKIVSSRKDVLNSLNEYMDSNGRLSWSKFVKVCTKRNLIHQIRATYKELL